MTALQTARESLVCEAIRSLREGDGLFSEADDGLNNASRKVVEAMFQAYGAAYFVEVNGYRELGWQPVRAWDGTSPIYNFCATAVMPRHDVEVERLCRERAAAEYTSTAADAERIKVIFGAVYAAGGVFLHWS